MEYSFEKSTKQFFSQLKSSKNPLELKVNSDDGEMVGKLVAVTKVLSKNEKVIENLAKWRKEFSFAFPSQFKVTTDGTARWLEGQLINKEDRILFLVFDKNKKMIGHMGLYSFDFKSETCEIDNVVRGEKSSPGLMTLALKKLISWSFKDLKIKRLYLRVFSDNKKAVEFYRRVGFKEKELIPLVKKIDGENLLWVEPKKNEKRKKNEKYFLRMVWNKKYGKKLQKFN